MSNDKPKKWRDWLPVHPAADQFPPMDADELRALADDIKANGLKQPVVFFIRKLSDSMPVLLDGRNRLDALELLGEDITLKNFAMFDQVPEDIDAVSYIVSVNIRRRHLTADDKRDLIAKLIKADPTKSNRQVAKIVGASHPYVAKVREESEKAGDVETVTTSVDNKSRRQPAHKAATTVAATAERRMRAVERKARELAARADEPADQMQEVAQQAAHYSVRAWESLSESDRKRIIAAASGNSQFNEQKTDSIEWARWSWNPVTGCLHDCPYCYARDIAERFYEQGFEPTFYPNRLTAPRNTKVPERAATDIGFRNVFVCSMADLFGKWVPEDCIEAVFEQVRTHLQWNFLFLTKFPQRLAEREWPVNAWCGTTVDTQARVKIAERAFRDVKAGVRWLSVEPMMERLTFTSLEMFNWIVIGGATKSTRTPAFDPPMEWVLHLLQQAHAAGIGSIYAKANLRALRGYPGAATLTAAPAAPAPPSAPAADADADDIPEFLRRGAEVRA